ncbi:hypothetical protein L596_030228 [Steinernema carpocapsae]|uniref:Nuclear receptor domain-containing protein n=1 Tax=Steinernema carpocapsae TaxID=34508 RepID=A0A4U5LS37_STECR|nr:hypothetical protein L596_030228 [Steinernema carpocapsae]
MEVLRSVDKRSDTIPPSVCLVCNRSASCFYYGVPSCSSCKAFFRRQVLIGRTLACKNGGTCRTVYGTTFCASCRFTKCIQVGMQAKEVGNSSQKLQPMIQTFDSTLCLKIKDMVYIEEKILRLRRSTFFPYNADKTLFEFYRAPCSLNESDKYQVVAVWPKQETWLTYNPILAKKGQKMWIYMDVVLAIDFYKTLGIMKQLSLQDQMALIKGTVVPLCQFLATCDAYFRGHDRVIHPDGMVPFCNLGEDPVTKPVQEGMVQACFATQISIEKVVLLKVIIALNSAARGLSPEARAILEEERLIHLKAVIKLVQTESRGTEWIHKFQQLYDFVNRSLAGNGHLSNIIYTRLLPALNEKSAFSQLWIDLWF